MQPADHPENRAAVHVGEETETDRGWSYRVTLQISPCLVAEHTVTLSWSDHDQITRGLQPPSETVRAAMQAVLDMGAEVFDPVELPNRLDFSTLRRMFRCYDDAVRDRLDDHFG